MARKSLKSENSVLKVLLGLETLIILALVATYVVPGSQFRGTTPYEYNSGGGDSSGYMETTDDTGSTTTDQGSTGSEGSTDDTTATDGGSGYEGSTGSDGGSDTNDTTDTSNVDQGDNGSGVYPAPPSCSETSDGKYDCSSTTRTQSQCNDSKCSECENYMMGNYYCGSDSKCPNYVDPSDPMYTVHCA